MRGMSAAAFASGVAECGCGRDGKRLLSAHSHFICKVMAATRCSHARKKGSGWAMSPKADRKRPGQMSINVINFNAQTRIYHVLRKNITSRRKYKRGKRDGGLRRWKYLHAIRVLT
jgi:hypothetical protein